jgi:hypothetical protein
MSENRGGSVDDANGSTVARCPSPEALDKISYTKKIINLSDLEASVCVARTTLDCLNWTPKEWEVYIDAHPKIWQKLFNIRHNLRYHVDKLPYIKTLCGCRNNDPRCLRKWVLFLYKNHRVTLKKIGVQFPDDLFRR